MTRKAKSAVQQAIDMIAEECGDDFVDEKCCECTEYAMFQKGTVLECANCFNTQQPTIRAVLH